MEGLEIVGTVSVEGNSLVLTGDMVPSLPSLPAVTICWTLQEDHIVQTSQLRYSLGSAGLC